MSQGSIMEVLEKAKKPLSVIQIAKKLSNKKLKIQKASIGHSLYKMFNRKEISRSLVRRDGNTGYYIYWVSVK